MNVLHVCKSHLLVTLVTLGASLGFCKALSAQPAPAETEKGAQVLTRGPVHEAFAEP